MDNTTEGNLMNSPFVRTPKGPAVVEVIDTDEFYVRFDDGSREWIATEDCEQIPEPEGYECPDPSTFPGVYL
jgi:hypothetical protein